MRSEPTIAFDYRPSRAVAACAAAVSIAATVAPWGSAIAAHEHLAAALSLAALAASLLGLRRFLAPGLRRVARRASGWTVVDAAAIEQPAELVSHVRVGPWIALGLRAADRRRFRVLIGPDNVDAETRRRLIVLLARGELAQTA